MTLLIGRGTNIDALNKFGHTPLYNAAAYGSTEVVNFLMLSDALVFYGKENPLHAAAANGYCEVANLLVKSRPYLIDTRNKYGDTPLDLARQRSN